MSERLLRLFEVATDAFRDNWGGEPDLLGFAPGRINLIGEHTDYTGGLAMPVAVDRYVVAALRARDDGRVRMGSDNDPERLDAVNPDNLEGWLRYGAGALQVFQASQGGPAGLDAWVVGDVPLGAGLSSSAAIELALLNGLAGLRGLSLDDLQLARLGQRVEHEFLGLQSGLLDQIASQASQAEHVLLIDFRAQTWRQIPADFGDWTWVLMDSGARRSLVETAYAERVAECAEGLAALQETGIKAEHWRDLPLQAVEAAAASPDAPVWARRLRHVKRENQRVLDFASLLQQGRIAELGPLLLASHDSLRDDYGVSHPALDALVELAIGLPGFEGGRMMGGGFGGCTLNLVQTDAVADFIATLSARFEARLHKSSPGLALTLVGGAGSYRPQR